MVQLPLRAEGHREQPARLRRGGLDVGEHHTGVDRDGPGHRIDLPDRPHPHQRQHHLAAGRVGHPTADQPGVATLGHDRHAGLSTGGHHGRDLRGRAGPDHRQCRALVRTGPVDDVGRDVGGSGQHVGVADGGTQAVEQVGHGFSFEGCAQPSTTATSSATGSEANVVMRMVSRLTSSPTR